MLNQMIMDMLPIQSHVGLRDLPNLFSNQLIQLDIHLISEEMTEQRYVSELLNVHFVKLLMLLRMINVNKLNGI